VFDANGTMLRVTAVVASHPPATIEWARQWPCEEVWKARKVFGLDRA
jgi:hypothetical protein